MTPTQRAEWLEEFEAWRTLPFTVAFFRSLELDQAEKKAAWTQALWDSEVDPPVEQLRFLKSQAVVIDDVINRKGTDVLASLYPDLREIAEGGGNQSGDETP